MPVIGPRASYRLPAWLLLALALGLGAGLLEVGLLGIDRYLLGRFIHRAPQDIWRAPVLYGALLGLFALAVWPLSRRGERLQRAGLEVLSVLAVFAPLTCLVPRLHPAAVLLLAVGAGTLIQRALIDRHAMVTRALPAAVGTLAAVVMLAGGSWHASEWWRDARAANRPQPAGTRPSVLLVVLDVARAADFSLHGYPLPTTPNLERLAARGVRFDRAIAPSSWTVPSHATMLTGQWPHELGIDWRTPLEPGTRTIGQVLQEQGYRTGGFVANRFYAGREKGMAAGFDRFEDYQTKLGEWLWATAMGRFLLPEYRLRSLWGTEPFPGRKRAPEVTEPFLRWIDGLEGRPFFAMLNYYEAHAPYTPPMDHWRRFDPEAAPWSLRHRFYRVRHPLPPFPSARDTAGVRRSQAAYDGALSYLDAEMARLVEGLRQRGLFDDLVLIVTSDHGEAFGEHGLFDHGNALLFEQIWVPLLIVAPGRIPEGAVVSAPASLRDLPATMLSLAAPSVSDALPGASLSRFWDDTPANDTATVLARVSGMLDSDGLPVSHGDVHSLVDGDYQYIQTGVDEALYRLTLRGADNVNLASEPARAADVQRFRARLDSMLGPRRPSP